MYFKAMSKVTKWVLASCLVSMAASKADGQSHVVLDERDGTNVNAQDRSFLDWVGLGTGPDVDPYIARTNSACLDGDLAECFKSRALVSLDEFFDKGGYEMTEHARVRRMPQTQLRLLSREPYEFSEIPRADESEWDQLVKFLMRKVEKFLKSHALEVDFSDEVTERGRYSPRFVDEIIDEIDVIEDKKDSLFKRKQLKKLFIPMLIILKLFKLKLLLFLPLILGLASFKKFLGFLAIVIPGLIAFFKYCKPTIQAHLNPVNLHNIPHYSQSGVALPSYHYKDQYSHDHQNNYYYGGGYGGYDKSIHFTDNNPQSLAYDGWSQYRSNGKSLRADVETTSKKSILPDS